MIFKKKKTLKNRDELINGLGREKYPRIFILILIGKEKGWNENVKHQYQ